MKDAHGDLAIFYGWPGRDGPMQIRERYALYACKACGKIDPREAVKAGFDADVLKRPPKADAFSTRDSQDVVSDRCLAAFEAALPGLVTSWRIGDQPWSLVFPTEIVMPGSTADPEGDVSPAFRSGRSRCPACGRWEELTIHLGRVSLPEGLKLGGYWVEQPRGCPNILWACNDDARDALTKHRLSGLKISKDFYGPTSPVWLTMERHRKPRKE